MESFPKDSEEAAQYVGALPIEHVRATVDSLYVMSTVSNNLQKKLLCFFSHNSQELLDTAEEHLNNLEKESSSGARS